MQLSLELLRKSGWYCEVTEKNIRIKATPPEKKDVTYKSDLLKFCDILCLRPKRMLLVQTTSLSNISARINKIRGLVQFEHAKQAGFEIQVHGWHAHGVKVVDLTKMETLWDSVIRGGHRNKKTPRKQEELAL